MFSYKSSSLRLALMAILASAAATAAHAGATLINSDGSVALGITDYGNQGYTDGILTTANGSGGNFGLAYHDVTNISGKYGAGAWLDVNTPGCICQGWGVSGNGIGAGADISSGGYNNLTVDSFTSTSSTATSVVHQSSQPDLQVKQEWAVSAATQNIFVNKVTITNTGASAITDVRFVSVMDFDVPPTEFDELITVKGVGTTSELLLSHDNGFSDPNPLNPGSALLGGTTNVDFTKSGPYDHGAYFQFGFGTLAAGESKTFDIFWGANSSESAALLDLGAVGAELYALGEPNPASTKSTITYDWGFKGVGGVIILPPPPTGAVPEPGTYGVIGALVLGGLVAIRRMKRSKA